MSVQMIGGIELTNNLIVPRLAELHQLLKSLPPQVNDKLLDLRFRHLTKFVSINGLHLNHWRLMLSDVVEVDQVVIEIKMKRLLELIVNPQILALFLI